MHRATLPPSARAVTRQLVFPNGRTLVRVPRRPASTSTGPVGSAPQTVPPRTARKTFRRVVVYTTLATGTFYVGSALLSFRSQAYHDFFVENVPLGTSVLQYAEENDWDEWEPATAIDAGVAVYEYGRGLVASLTGTASGEAKGAAGDAKAAAQAASVKAQATVDTAVAKATAAKDTVVAKASAAKDTVVAKTAAAKDTVVAAKDTVVGKAVAAKDAAVEKAQTLRTAAPGSMKDVKDRAKAPAQAAVDAAKAAEQTVKDAAVSVSDDVKALVAQAEAALAGKPYSEASDADVAPSSEPAAAPVAANVYSAPLPLGFEPPPGFSRPAPPKAAAAAPAAPPKTVEAAPAPPPLPLVAPAVAALAGSEPVIAQLAGTIDELASYLNAHPTAADKARDVLSTAQVDLEALAGRIDAVRKDEHAKLEASLEQQAGEYNSKLIELEIDAQTRLDAQEEGFRKGLDEQKAEIITAYRAKLERELETQSEIINERLKEEVVAQGIELQRRWIREIKVRVEQERGGRLAKLDELAAHLKRLESLALDHSAYLDENVRVHALWSALRAVSHAVDAPVRRPFRAELRRLRGAAAAADDPALAAALTTLEAGAAADIGVEPRAHLAAWFTSAVAPRVESVALVPDTGAGLLAHLASHALSTVRFRRTGRVEGGDVLSVLARAEYLLTEKDLDAAARELNQLRGPPKALLADWLAAARQRLEVEQALEVIHTHATVASLLVV